MSMEELLQKLDMQEISDMDYAESFCNLMEFDENIEEGMFHRLFADMTFDSIKELTDTYMGEIITSVPDDCIDFFTFISTYKRSLSGMINCCSDDDDMRRVVAELFRFREWYQDQSKVLCIDMDENREFKSSICNALVMSRMEKLSLGSYSFDFEEAMDYDYEEYEDYSDTGYDEEYDELYEYEENDPRVTLVDRDNPVIDGENYDDGGEYLQ